MRGRVLPRLLLALLFCAGLCTSASAFAVYGAIGDKYNQLGKDRSPVGAPLSDEADAPYGGRFNNFRWGAIYWHPTIGAHAVWGAIFGKWNELGRVGYGYPITDETGTPDGRGRYNHFRALQINGKPEASIYWTPQTGAHAVYGAIRAKWAEQGWERGRLGYPVSDEYQDGNGRRSDFEWGSIRWTAAGGAVVSYAGSLLPPTGGFGDIAIRGVEVAVMGRPIGGNTAFLSEMELCRIIRSSQDRIGNTIKDLARGQINPRIRPFSIRSDARVQMSPNCGARAAVVTACADSARIRLLLPRNVFFINITTPGPLPGWADPRFSIDFDLSADAQIILPTRAGAPLGLGQVTVRATNLHWDSQNLTGDVVRLANSIATLLTGNDLTAQFTRDLSFSFGGVTTTLGQLSPLTSRLPANARVESCVVGNVLRLDGRTDPAPPPLVVR